MHLKELLKKNKPDYAENLIRTRHVLMLKYGWIPLEEFKKEPMIWIDALIEEIRKDFEYEQRELNKAKMKKRR